MKLRENIHTLIYTWTAGQACGDGMNESSNKKNTKQQTEHHISIYYIYNKYIADKNMRIDHVYQPIPFKQPPIKTSTGTILKRFKTRPNRFPARNITSNIEATVKKKKITINTI